MSAAVDSFVRGRATGAGRRRRWLGPVLAGTVLLLVALVALQPTESGVPFDPTSTGPTGLRAVVDTLDALGVPVTVVDDPAAAATADTVLVPPLGWPREVVDDLAVGGTRVVAEVPPTDDAVVNPLGVGGIGLVDLTPDCALLADVGSLRTSQWTGWQPPSGAEVAERCLVVDGTAWLHRMVLDDGELVSLATMAPLTNARFLDSDAAVAAVRLLAPAGDERVVVLAAPPGEPPPTLFDLLDPRWFDAAWLSLAGLVVLALARGRRLGRPIDEQLPVRVPAGELARAIGDLRHRAGHHERAAAALRDRTLRACRHRLGLAPTAPAAAVLEALAARGVPVAPSVAAVLGGERPVTDGDQLVAAARALAELRDGLRGASSASSSPPDDRSTP